MRVKDHWRILIDIIMENKCEKVAEIGIWKGSTTRNVLSSPAKEVVKEYWAIDQWDKYYPGYDRHVSGWDQETWDSLYFKTCKLLPYFPQLKVIKMTSVKAAKLFWKGYFDLVYIDSNHTHDFIKEDIEAWLPLIKRGGVIAGHDYAYCDGEGGRDRCDVKPVVDDRFGESNIEARDCQVWLKKL